MKLKIVVSEPVCRARAERLWYRPAGWNLDYAEFDRNIFAIRFRNWPAIRKFLAQFLEDYPTLATFWLDHRINMHSGALDLLGLLALIYFHDIKKDSSLPW